MAVLVAIKTPHTQDKSHGGSNHVQAKIATSRPSKCRMDGQHTLSREEVVEVGLSNTKLGQN
jgi:hypothetical protein